MSQQISILHFFMCLRNISGCTYIYFIYTFLSPFIQSGLFLLFFAVRNNSTFCARFCVNMSFCSLGCASVSGIARTYGNCLRRDV